MSSLAASSDGAEVPPRAALHSSPSTELIADAVVVQSTPAAMSFTPPVLSAASSTASLASRVQIAEYKGGGDEGGSGSAATGGSGGAGDSPQRSHPASSSSGGGGTVGRRALAGQTREELRAAFSVFDTDGSGSITVSEFSVVFKMLGYTAISDSELTEMVSALDQNEDGRISFEEFVSVMTTRRARGAAPGGAGATGGGGGGIGGLSGGGGGLPDPVDDALSVFDTSDPKITRMDSSELWHICGLLKENLSEEERDSILKEMHADAEGNINFAKIVQQMMPGNA